jgi:hypothetical protein
MLIETTHYGKPVWYFDTNTFEVKGATYMIVGTENTGRGVMDCKHRIRHGDKMQYVFEITMHELVKRIKNAK